MEWQSPYRQQLSDYCHWQGLGELVGCDVPQLLWESENTPQLPVENLLGSQKGATRHQRLLDHLEAASAVGGQ